MIDDTTYKVSLTFALLLHLVLMFFLFVRFNHSRSDAALGWSNNIINAVTINERDFDNQLSKKMVSQLSSAKQETVPQKVVKKPEKEQPAVNKEWQNILKENLLAEQAREVLELKKEKQRYKKKIAKQKEQALQKILHDQIALEQKQLADAQSEAISGAGSGIASEAHGSRSSGEIDKYKALIIQAISSQWISPEGTGKGDLCELLINVAPGGVVLDVKLITSSGNKVLDRSALAAILKASPLPVPDDPKLFDEVRTIKLTFKPEGIVGS